MKTWILAIIFVLPMSECLAQDFAAERQKLIDGLGGKSIETFCKMESYRFNIEGRKIESIAYTHKSYFECMELAKQGKGFFANKEQWKISFDANIDELLGNWSDALTNFGKLNVAFVESVVRALKEREELQQYALGKSRSSKSLFSFTNTQWEDACKFEALATRIEVESSEKDRDLSVIVGTKEYTDKQWRSRTAKDFLQDCLQNKSASNADYLLKLYEYNAPQVAWNIATGDKGNSKDKIDKLFKQFE